MTDAPQDGSNTAPEQRKTVGRPFTKGDPRINRNGRPRSFDQLRKLAQQIAHERIAEGSTVTAAEAILRQMAHDNPEHFIEIAFGKVPDQSENINIDLNNLTDEQLERLARGGSVRSIVTSKSSGNARIKAAATNTNAVIASDNAKDTA